MDKLGQGLSPDLLKNLLNPNDPLRAIVPMMQFATPDMLANMLKDVDMLKWGGDILHFACKEGKKEIVELLIKMGASVANPPDRITHDENYRKSPFVL